MQRHIGSLQLGLDDFPQGSAANVGNSNNTRSRNTCGSNAGSNDKSNMLETNAANLAANITQSGEIQQKTKNDENGKKSNDECNQNTSDIRENTINDENIPNNGQQSIAPSTSANNGQQSIVASTSG